MHAVIYEKGTGKIRHVVNNCIRKGAHFVGDKKKVCVNLKLFDIMWTNDNITPIIDENGKTIGWNKNITEITPSTDTTEIKPVSKSDIITAMKIRKLVDNLTYQELETYIENNITDLPSAKEFIKTLAKVTLALCKIVDSK